MGLLYDYHVMLTLEFVKGDRWYVSLIFLTLFLTKEKRWGHFDPAFSNKT